MYVRNLFYLGALFFCLGATAYATEPNSWPIEDYQLEDAYTAEEEVHDIYGKKRTECPVGSGAYCDKRSPVCCLIHNEYQCRKSLSDCKE